jgi:hypothetical protein
MLPTHPPLLQREEVAIQVVENSGGNPDAKVVGPSANDWVHHADEAINTETPSITKCLLQLPPYRPHGFPVWFDKQSVSTLGVRDLVLPDVETQEVETVVEVHDPGLLR